VRHHRDAVRKMMDDFSGADDTGNALGHSRCRGAARSCRD
jgi:hypothetical protein